MSVYVVDASVVAKWFIDEVHSRAARSIVSGPHDLHAPDFLLLEMDSFFLKRVRRGDISGSDATDARALLARLSIAYHPFRAVQGSAYELASRISLSVYDAVYAALAVVLGAELVTADRRLYDALAGGGLKRHAAWVEDVR